MAREEPVLLECLRTGGTVFVTVSDGETLEVAPESLPADMPGVGEPLSARLRQQLRQGAERKAVARRLFRLLDRRLYPTADLRQKLGEEGFAPAAVAAVLDDFAEKGVFSDRRFAEAFCRDTLRRRPVGRRYLVARLAQKRVATAVAEAVVAEILSSERERELALQAGRDRWARVRDPVDPGAEAKVARFLQSRGFAPTLARRVAWQTAPHREDSA